MADAILQQLSARTMFDLQGVVAVVTGGGSGIGLMMSSALVANGATVYMIGLKQEDLDRIAKVYNDGAEKAGKPGRMYGIEGDIRSKEEAKRLAAELEKREGHITVLFNNAGVARGLIRRPAASASADEYVKEYFDSLSQDDFAESYATNAVGPYWMTFAFLPLLEKWKLQANRELAEKFVPQVIMTSSMNGWTKDSATAGQAYPYIFSKSAIGHATASLAHELLPLGIRVNAIAPGFFQTEMTAPGSMDAFGRSSTSMELQFEIPTQNPKRGGTTKDVGGLVLMLLTNGYVNGETVLLDGGTLLKHPSSW